MHTYVSTYVHAYRHQLVRDVSHDFRAGTSSKGRFSLLLAIGHGQLSGGMGVESWQVPADVWLLGPCTYNLLSQSYDS